ETMAQTYRKVRIFVASPGDVSDERERLAQVVETMNRSGNVAERLGLTLELLRWETHVAPEVGRPQGVVFDQLAPQEWDIFVGILWMRFGTSTGRTDPDTGEVYRSGTEEEFKAALRQRKTGTGERPRIMVYRCVRPVDPLKIDITQYTYVQQFFSQFHAEGEHPGLVKNYTDGNEFERLIREDLDKAIWEYAEQHKSKPPDLSDSSRAADAEAGDAGKADPASAHPAVTMPGMFRYLLDRWLPRAHT